MSTSICHLLNLEIQNMKTGLQTTPSQRKNTTEIIWIKLAAVLVFYLCHIALNKINRFFFGVLPSPPPRQKSFVAASSSLLLTYNRENFFSLYLPFYLFQFSLVCLLSLENTAQQLDLKLCLCMHIAYER